MPMRNPIPLALALALVSTGLQLAALFPEHTPQYWQLLVLIGIAGQLLAVIVVTGARRTRRAFAAVVQTDPLTQIGNRRRLQSLLGSGQSFLVIFIDLDHFARFVRLIYPGDDSLGGFGVKRAIKLRLKIAHVCQMGSRVTIRINIYNLGNFLRK